MRLSVVSTLYLSEPYVEEFCARASAAAAALTDEYEIVLVNDGSPDGALATALRIQRRDPHVRVIDLSRNFGHHKAVMTGLEHARGDLVFLIDCDLEEDPAWLARFHERLQESGADVVYGVQARRRGRLFERMSGSLYYALFNLLSTHRVEPNQVMARLMTRRYVDSLLRHREREVYLAGLWAITGYEQVAETVVKGSKGSSAYDLRRKTSMAIDSITSFSNRPLLLIFWLGLAISAVSLLAGAALIVTRLFIVEFASGWPSLIVSIWFLGGVTLSCLGVIGIYLAKVFTEAKHRPYTIVRQVYPPEVGGPGGAEAGEGRPSETP